MMTEIENLEDQEFLKAFGNRIKALRKERGWSIRDMIVQHGYHESQWRRFERGGAVNIYSLLRIAKAFRTSLSCLLDGLGEFGEPSNAVNIEKSRMLKSPSTMAAPSEELESEEQLGPPLRRSSDKADLRRRATDKEEMRRRALDPKEPISGKPPSASKPPLAKKKGAGSDR